ncbi:hypothetical protein PO909_014964 [Leuciscus waleckii]
MLNGNPLYTTAMMEDALIASVLLSALIGYNRIQPETTQLLCGTCSFYYLDFKCMHSLYGGLLIWVLDWELTSPELGLAQYTQLRSGAHKTKGTVQVTWLVWIVITPPKTEKFTHNPLEEDLLPFFLTSIPPSSDSLSQTESPYSENRDSAGGAR